MEINDIRKAFIGFLFGLVGMWMFLDIMSDFVKLDPIYIFLLMGLVVIAGLWIAEKAMKVKERIKGLK